MGGITDSMNMSLSKLWEIVNDKKVWHAAVHGVTKSPTRLSNLTITTKFVITRTDRALDFCICTQ